MTAEASAFERSFEEETQSLPSKEAIQPRRDSLSVIPSSLKEAWIFLSCASVTGSAGGILAGESAPSGESSPRGVPVASMEELSWIASEPIATGSMDSASTGSSSPMTKIRGDQPECVPDGPPTQHLAAVPLPRAAGLHEPGLAGVVDSVGARDPFVATAQGDGAGIAGLVEGFEPDSLAFGEGQLQLDAHRQPAADEGHRA